MARPLLRLALGLALAAADVYALAATTPFAGGAVHPGAPRIPSSASGAFLVFSPAQFLLPEVP